MSIEKRPGYCEICGYNSWRLVGGKIICSVCSKAKAEKEKEANEKKKKRLDDWEGTKEPLR